MRVLVGVLSVALIALMLAEFFVTFLLPRRVKRDPRIARQFFVVVWRPWRAIAARLSRAGGDTMLGIFGPIGLLFLLGFLSAGVIVGFAGLHWADRSDLGVANGAHFGNDLYFSAGSFFTASTTTGPVGGVAKFLQIAEAGSGFAVLFISIGYLPALFQAFSRRETAISQLDPRAGSPPTAGALLQRSGQRGGWSESWTTTSASGRPGRPRSWRPSSRIRSSVGFDRSTSTRAGSRRSPRWSIRARSRSPTRPGSRSTPR